MWTTNLINSVLKLLLYGPRIRIIYSYPGNIGNRGLQHSLSSWKYWKTDFFNSVVSWEYCNTYFFTQSYPGNSGSYDPYISPILEILDRTIHISVLSWKYWIARSIYKSYPGNSGSYDRYISPILEIVDRTILGTTFSHNKHNKSPSSLLRARKDMRHKHSG